MEDNKVWSTNRVRETFISFFQEHQHQFVPSSPVVLPSDPTLLFANAGMNQFKPIFLGKIDPSSPFAKLVRVANSQKCIRAGGKHNDLEDVGKDSYHHTFFEMLGSWSFGDYFKKEAIQWAWELMTEVYKIDKTRLYFTYFGGNDQYGLPADLETRDFWKQYVPENRILPCGMKDNFWEMGETGPCGPCTEIHYDKIGNRDAASLVNKDDPTVIEIWNLVFMQFNREEPNGLLKKLPATHVDTGMGLERLASVLQNVMTNYEIDSFQQLFQKIHEKTNSSVHPYTGKYGAEDADKVDTAYRVIADHIRTILFSLVDGVIPSADGRGYVIRRIIRRAARFGKEKLSAPVGFLSRLLPDALEVMKVGFPELAQIDISPHVKLLESEELAFSKSLERGLKQFTKFTGKLSPGQSIPGPELWKLYDTYGFPFDLTRLMAEEKGLVASEDDFELEKSKRPKSSVVRKSTINLNSDALSSKNVPRTNDKPKFLLKDTEATLLAIYRPSPASLEQESNDFPTELENFEGEVGLVFDQTNFYAEMGGQIYDVGKCVSLSDDSSFFQVEEVQSSGGYIVHIGRLGSPKSSLKVGDKYKLQVEYDRKGFILKNHTSTHLLNHSMRQVLGKAVQQKGSLVLQEKLRFDFNWKKPLTGPQIEKIEQIINDIIKQDLEVYAEEVSLEKAADILGVQKVFGEHYPDPVRVLSVGVPIADLLADPKSEKWEQYSIEFCGGNHLNRSSEAQGLTVVKEEGLGQDVRRVTAVTAIRSLDVEKNGQHIRRKLERAKTLKGAELREEVGSLLELLETDYPARCRDEFQNAVKALQKTLNKEGKDDAAEKKSLADSYVEKTVNSLKEKGEQAFFVEAVPFGHLPPLVLDVIKRLRDPFPNMSVLLCSVDDKKDTVLLVASVSPAAVGRGVKAGEWVSSAAKSCGGKGGGKADTAQGNFTGAAKVNDAVQAALSFAS